MTNDALSVIEFIFGSLWSLFNSWYIPGTNVTPGVLLFGILFLTIMFRVVRNLVGAFGSGSGGGKSE